MPLYQHEGTDETDGERRRVVSGSLEDERLAASDAWSLVDETRDQAAEQSGETEQTGGAEQTGQVEQSAGSRRRPRGPQTGDEQPATGGENA